MISAKKQNVIFLIKSTKNVNNLHKFSLKKKPEVISLSLALFLNTFHRILKY